MILFLKSVFELSQNFYKYLVLDLDLLTDVNQGGTDSVPFLSGEQGGHQGWDIHTIVEFLIFEILELILSDDFALLILILGFILFDDFIDNFLRLCRHLYWTEKNGGREMRVWPKLFSLYIVQN